MPHASWGDMPHPPPYHRPTPPPYLVLALPHGPSGWIGEVQGRLLRQRPQRQGHELGEDVLQQSHSQEVGELAALVAHEAELRTQLLL